MWDSILGPWDHTPSQRQTLNHGATQETQYPDFTGNWLLKSELHPSWSQAASCTQLPSWGHCETELGITHSWVVLVKVALRTGQGILLTSLCRKLTGPILRSLGRSTGSKPPLKATHWICSETKRLKELFWLVHICCS